LTACQAAHRACPAGLLADYDPGQPWLHWGCMKDLVEAAFDVHRAGLYNAARWPPTATP
jgi:hypothetical protein